MCLATPPIKLDAIAGDDTSSGAPAAAAREVIAGFTDLR